MEIKKLKSQSRLGLILVAAILTLFGVALHAFQSGSELVVGVEAQQNGQGRITNICGGPNDSAGIGRSQGNCGRCRNTNGNGGSCTPRAGEVAVVINCKDGSKSGDRNWGIECAGPQGGNVVETITSGAVNITDAKFASGSCMVQVDIFKKGATDNIFESGTLKDFLVFYDPTCQGTAGPPAPQTSEPGPGTNPTQPEQPANPNPGNPSQPENPGTIPTTPEDPQECQENRSFYYRINETGQCATETECVDDDALHNIVRSCTGRMYMRADIFNSNDANTGGNYIGSVNDLRCSISCITNQAIITDIDGSIKAKGYFYQPETLGDRSNSKTIIGNYLLPISAKCSIPEFARELEAKPSNLDPAYFELFSATIFNLKGQSNPLTLGGRSYFNTREECANPNGTQNTPAPNPNTPNPDNNNSNNPPSVDIPLQKYRYSAKIIDQQGQSICRTFSVAESIPRFCADELKSLISAGNGGSAVCNCATNPGSCTDSRLVTVYLENPLTEFAQCCRLNPTAGLNRNGEVLKCADYSPAGNVNGHNTSTGGFLKSVSAAAGEGSSLDITKSGRYEFSLNNEQLTEKDIIVQGNSLRIKPFYDNNSNGIKDIDEQYLTTEELSELTINLDEAATVDFFDLNAGWNLIHIPLVDDREPVDSRINSAAKLIAYWRTQGADITQVARYSNGTFQSYTHRETGNSFAEDFKFIPGEALYVQNKSGRIRATFSGKPISGSLPVNLKVGWNMIGLVSSEQNLKAEGVLAKINGQSTISQFENGLYQSVIKDSSGQPFGNNFNVISKRGYFVRTEQSQQLQP